MALSIHDNHLVSYEVFSEQRRIVLRTEYRGGGRPPEVTSVIFTGVEGYHFELDCFGNILFDIQKVPVERILEERAEELRAASRHVNWPWVKDLPKAHEWLHGKGIDGFLIDSSLGLCGWVLAQNAVLSPEATEPSNPRTKDHLQPGLYEVSPEGLHRSLTGSRLIAALGDGRELAFTLPERGGREYGIYVRSIFNALGGDLLSEGGRGPRPETWSGIVVHPGGGNVMTLNVEARSATDGRLVVGPSELDAVHAKNWCLVEGESRHPLPGRSFVLSLGKGRSVMLDAPQMGSWRDGVRVYAGTMPSKEEIEIMRSGGPMSIVPMSVQFGGGNALHILLGEPYGGKAMERIQSRPKE